MLLGFDFGEIFLWLARYSSGLYGARFLMWHVLILSLNAAMECHVNRHLVLDWG